MKQKTILLGIFLLVIGTTLVTAIEPEFIFRQGIATDLKIYCMDDNTGLPCDSLFNCSVTIQYPDTTLMAHDMNITRQGGYYNYTLPNTDTLGFYQYQSYCTNGTTGGFSEEKYFLINVLGEQVDTSKAMLYLGGLVICVVFFLLSLFGAIKVPFDNKRDERGYIIGLNDLKYVKIFLWFVSYILLLSIFFIAQTVTGFLEAGVATNIFNAGFWFLLVFLFPAFTLFLIMVIVRFVKDKKIEELSLRNIKVR